MSLKFSPYLFRDIKNKITLTEGLFLVIISSRTFIWDVSYDFRNMGLIAALLYTIIITVIVIHCTHIVFRGMHVLCCRNFVPYITYTEAASEILRENMKCCLWIGYVFQFFLAAGMWVFHFNKICCDYLHVVRVIQTKIFLEMNGSDVILKTLIFIPHLLVFSIHKLRNLAFLSIMSSVAFCLFYIAGEIDEITQGKSQYVPDPNPIKMINLSHLALAIPSNILSSTLPIGVYLAVEKHIEDPKQFLKPFGILNIGIISMTIVQSIIGIFGYCYYGVNTKTNDFYFYDNVFGKAFILGETFAVMISFCVHGYCAVTIIWNELIKPFVRTRGQTYIYLSFIRFFICVMVYLIGILENITRFRLLEVIIRGSTLPFFGLVGPAVLDLFTRESYGRFKVILITDLLIIISAFVYSYIHVYSSLITWWQMKETGFF